MTPFGLFRFQWNKKLLKECEEYSSGTLMLILFRTGLAIVSIDGILSFLRTQPRHGSGYSSSPFRAGNLAPGIAAVSPAPQPNTLIIAKPPRPNQARRFANSQTPLYSDLLRLRRMDRLGLFNALIHKYAISVVFRLYVTVHKRLIIRRKRPKAMRMTSDIPPIRQRPFLPQIP